MKTGGEKSARGLHASEIKDFNSMSMPKKKEIYINHALSKTLKIHVLGIEPLTLRFPLYLLSHSLMSLIFACGREAGGAPYEKLQQTGNRSINNNIRSIKILLELQ